MKPVMEYQNFRVYVRDFYTERKDRSGFTWRDFAREAGYSSPVFLKLVCDGKANLSEVGVERVAAAMGLAGVDLQYFRELVAFNQAKDGAEKKSRFAHLRCLARENNREIIGEDQYDYFESWKNPVLREMAPNMPGATPAQLASKLAFDAETAGVKKSLNLLQKTVLLVGSMVLYFTFMFLTEKYAKRKCAFTRKSVLLLCVLGLSFVALMLLFREMMYVNIAITVLYVYAIFFILFVQGRKAETTL